MDYAKLLEENFYSNIENNIIITNDLEKYIFDIIDNYDLFIKYVTNDFNLDTQCPHSGRKLLSYVQDVRILNYFVSMNYDITKSLDIYGRNYFYYCTNLKCVTSYLHYFDVESKDKFGIKCYEYNLTINDYLRYILI